MDLKMQLISEWLKGDDTVSELSRSYEVSRQTVYKWIGRYKGEDAGDRSRHRRWCYPLTITDNASRYLIGCRGVGATDYAQVCSVFEWTFYKYGLPEAILSDNARRLPAAPPGA